MSKFLDKNALTYLWGKIKSLLGNKVDVVAGKGLSTNDYTTVEKTKLGGIAENANNYTHPTTTGNKHVPSGGAANQILRWSADGTAIWGADTDTVYTHPTTTGNKHVPSGGSTGQILRWNADGEAVWGADNNTTYAVATGSVNGLMSSADFTKLAAFGSATTYALKTDITGIYKYKGTVATVGALPPTGNVLGDVYDVTAGGANYAWNGTAWDNLGGTFTIDPITNAEIDAILAS